MTKEICYILSTAAICPALFLLARPKIHLKSAQHFCRSIILYSVEKGCELSGKKASPCNTWVKIIPLYIVRYATIPIPRNGESEKKALTATRMPAQPRFSMNIIRYICMYIAAIPECWLRLGLWDADTPCRSVEVVSVCTEYFVRWVSDARVYFYPPNSISRLSRIEAVGFTYFSTAIRQQPLPHPVSPLPIP